MTLRSYLLHLEDAFIIKKTIRFDTKGKKYLNTLAKYYFVDIGVRNAILNFKQMEEKNHILENIVFNELITLGYNVDIGNVLINENHNKKMLEIDFIPYKFNKKYYIQVTQTIFEKKKQEQEKRPLLSTKEGYKKIIITLDSILLPYYDDDGILIMDIFQFLLNYDSLDKF